MKPLMDRIRQNQNALFIYVVYFFVVAVVSHAPIWFFGSTDISVLHDLPGLFTIPMLWFSLKKIDATYDEDLFEEYRDSAPAGLLETISFILHRRTLYLDLMGLSLCYLILPFSICFRPISTVFHLEIAGLHRKLLLFPPLFAMYLLLSAAAKLLAILKWKRDEKIGQGVFQIFSTEQFYEERNQKMADSSTITC